MARSDSASFSPLRVTSTCCLVGVIVIVCPDVMSVPTPGDPGRFRPGREYYALMNEAHLAICSSPEWARLVEDELLPWVLEGRDLGDEPVRARLQVYHPGPLDGAQD